MSRIRIQVPDESTVLKFGDVAAVVVPGRGRS